MTLREIAHAAQLLIQSHAAGLTVRRGHAYELLAAAFAAGSWAAFLSDSVLADAGAGDPPLDSEAELIARAVQLGFPQQVAEDLAPVLLRFMAERQLSRVRWSAIAGLLAVDAPVEEHDFDGDEAEDDFDPDEVSSAAASGVVQESLLKSPLLMTIIEERAGELSPERHHALAALFRCARPSPYLYEESLKGRVLTTIERRWADEYLQLEPRFRRYERHLKAAAIGGRRAAAVEYAAAFDSPEFFALAERLAGEVDAEEMVQLAPTPQARARWLSTAAEQGSEAALRELAHAGDRSAQERLAKLGDPSFLRVLVEDALERRDALRAWAWQYVAVGHGVDFTKSTLRAYHDGGSQDGEFYDSDFGGPLYVAGDEALELPAMSRAQHKEARGLARKLVQSTS